MALQSSESIYPTEWSDDQVMDVLFSPFRENRHVNPRSWDSKLNFWTDMIRRYCSCNKLLIFNARQLPIMFERNGKVPACLNIVLEDLTKNRIVQPLSDYVSSSSGWVSWSFDVLMRRPVRWGYQSFVKQPLSWAYGKLVGNESFTRDSSRPKSREQIVLELPNEYFVMVELIKGAATAIYQRHCMSVTCRLTDEVIGFYDLARHCKDICADEQSFEVAIMELCRQKKCVIGIGTQGEKVIRMVSDQSVKVANFSDADMKIYRLKNADAKLEEAIKNTADEMEQCRSSAKTFLQQGKKSAALKCLRRKKLLDARQAQHEQAIEKIHSLLDMLQQTESQKQIIDAFATGVEAFKGLKNRYGLTEDSVEDTMLKIQEVFDDNEAINQSMAQSISGDTIDDDELQRELDDLLAAKGLATSTPLRPTFPEFSLNSLPDVPSHEPARSVSTRPASGGRVLLTDGGK